MDMPMHERLPVKVTLTVEVDGHTLTFEETGKAAGARYNGETAPTEYRDSVLEQNIRDAVDDGIAAIKTDAMTLFGRMYPVARDLS